MKKRKHCIYCGQKITQRSENNVIRDYCPQCDQFFYDNPLPVVASIVVVKRQILLVKRNIEPQKGKWCLPSGYAESGESIEAAALRELKEETGINGKIIGFVDIDSGFSLISGDLLFVTFEAEWMSGTMKPGDDAEKVRLWDIDRMPPLAFDSHNRAVSVFCRSKKEYWDMVDSFHLSVGESKSGRNGGNYLSDKLVRTVEINAEVIAKRWLDEVRSNPSTPSHARAEPMTIYQRSLLILGHFSHWLSGTYSDQLVREFYRGLGISRKAEGYALSEMLSALSLLRKTIWDFALEQHVLTSTIDIYMSQELERRMILFFDRAAYYIARGFEEGS
jgi:ADP-ribose pyrophosphatase YjhB (NUDIX family)